MERGETMMGPNLKELPENVTSTDDPRSWASAWRSVRETRPGRQRSVRDQVTGSTGTVYITTESLL